MYRSNVFLICVGIEYLGLIENLKAEDWTKIQSKEHFVLSETGDAYVLSLSFLSALTFCLENNL